MSENNESNNIGCIIAIVLLVIVNIVYFFATESAESIAETGGVLLIIAGLAIAYFVCKALFGNKSKDGDGSKVSSHKSTPSTPTSQTNVDDNTNKSTWGCIFKGLACIVVTVIIIGSITSSFSFNYAVGIGFAVVLAIVIGVLIYNSLKD